MNIKELQDVLSLLEQMYAVGGASKQAQEIRGVVAALGPHEKLTVEEFVATVGASLNRDTPSVAAVPPTSNDDVVRHYITVLLAAGTDRPVFDQALSELKKDRAVRVAEAKQIANKYITALSQSEHIFSFASKTAAFDAIFDEYIERAQFSSKMGIIDRMTKWASG